MNIQPQPQRSIPLNTRITSVPKSATLAINEKSKQLQLEGRDIIRLGLGQSPFPVPDSMVAHLQDYAAAKDYMAVQGYLPLREAIAGYLARSEGLDVDASHIIVGPGSKELFFGLQMALDCDLVLPAPSWVSYDPQARLLARSVHWLPCRAQDGWKLTPATLEKHCEQNKGRRQLLILNSPNNPSGACFSEQELKDLAQVASRYDVIVLSDEIYSELHYTGEHVSMARFYPKGTIVSNGISKWAGAGGWRLGFLAIPDSLKPVLDNMITIASETYTSVSAPIQMASIGAFEGSNEIVDYIRACRRIMRGVGLNFSAMLRDNGIDTVDPQGGFYCLGDFSTHREKFLQHGINNAEKMCQSILDATGVALLPGADFGLRQGFFVRFAFVDIDGHALLNRVLDDPSTMIDSHTVELQRSFEAARRLGDWLRGL